MAANRKRATETHPVGAPPTVDDVFRALERFMEENKTTTNTILKDINTLKETTDAYQKKSDAYQKKSDAHQQKTDAYQKKSDAHQQKTDACLQVLIGCNPAAALSVCKPAVAAAAHVAEAVIDGAVATWTYVSRKEKVYALGCAHCALYYGTRCGMKSFVSLPKSVVDCKALSIGFLNPGTFSNPLPTWQDFVAVEVEKAPEGLNPTAWGTPISAAREFFCIAGRATSGNVTGEGRFVVTNEGEASTEGTERKHGMFVETGGEPGHSGTLLFGFDGGEPTPLGLYCGIGQEKHAMRPRGRVALFPPFTEISWLAVKNPNVSTEIEVTDSKSVRKCRWVAEETELIDGTSAWPGVFVDKQFSYVGSFDVGSCRAM